VAALDVSASGPQQRSTGWGLPLAVLIAGIFMSNLDITIVNVAIPTIQNEFGVTTDDAQWVVTAYALTEGVAVPVSAWLEDRSVQPRAAGVRRRIGAVRPGLEFGQPGDVPDRAGDRGRDDPLLDIRIFRYGAYTQSLVLIAMLMV
jgi:MFS family permease